MKIYVDKLDVLMELKNNGIQLSVYDNDNKYLGKLKVGKRAVEWCKGKTHIGNGIKVNPGMILFHILKTINCPLIYGLQPPISNLHH